MALLGATIIGKFSGSRTGHHLNNELLHKLMANEHAWQYATIRDYHNRVDNIVAFPNEVQELNRKISI